MSQADVWGNVGWQTSGKGLEPAVCLAVVMTKEKWAVKTVVSVRPGTCKQSCCYDDGHGLEDIFAQDLV